MMTAFGPPGVRLAITEVLENIADGFVALDRERRFLYVNEVAEGILGRSRAELVGRSLYEACPELAGSDFDHALAEAERTDRRFEHEYFHPSWGRWFSNRICPSAWGLSVYLQDVTASRRTEAALGVSERQYQTLIDSIDQGFCVIELLFDANGKGVDYRFLEVNRVFAEQTGLVDPLGQRMRVLAPDHEEIWFETFARVAATGESARFESAAKAVRRWFDVYAFRYGAPAARRVGVLFKDISARKRVDDALRDSEERFRMLVEGIAQAVWETDAEGLPIDDCPAWRKLTGQSLEGWLAGRWLDVVHEDDRDFVARCWNEACEKLLPINLQYRLLTAEGSFRWTNDRAAPLLDSEGRARKWVGMNIDITERRHAEEALREAGRRKDEFLAILAHELRNPLAPLRTGLEIMRLAKGDAGRIEQVRAMMERQIDQMVSLVDDLLDLSRISRGRVQLERRTLDLASVIRGAVESCERILRQQDHELTLSLPAEAVCVFGDSTRLIQAVGNLLTNAAKYTESGGKVGVGLVRENNQAVISVRDNGVGIPADMLEEVFELFRQVGSGVNRSQGGLGIGLTVVRQLVELHGGTIEARSEGPGKGSEFTIRLPASQATAAAQAPDGERNASRTSRRILVVDDNQDAASSLSTMLELGGHSMRVAYDGQQALKIAAEHRPEVVLMDLGMPNLNGYEAARRMREEPWGRDALLVAVTGWGQQADRAASEQAGFDYHLVKPVDPEAVQALLSALDGP